MNCNCKFCKNPCERDNTYGNHEYISFFVCRNCPEEVDYRVDNNDLEVYSIQIIFFLKENKYSYLETHTKPNGIAYEEAVFYKWDKSLNDYNLRAPILEIPISNITPSNVKEKLLTYLTFS